LGTAADNQLVQEKNHGCQTAQDSDPVFSPDPEPAGVEFLGAELPEHVRAFFDEQRKSCEPK
jgi:hypothetical protein